MTIPVEAGKKDKNIDIYSKISQFLLKNPIIILLFLGLVIQLININNPTFGNQAWRQADTATIARQYYLHGYNFFSPEVNWNGTEPEYISSEFPILPFVWALIYKFTGETLVIARLFGILFTLISAFLVYRLAKHFFSTSAAFYSTLIFLFSPITILLGKTIQPEPAMLCFSIGAIYSLVKWEDSDNYLYLLTAIFCTASAFLLKIPTVYLLLPIIWIFYTKFGKAFIKKPVVYAYIIISIIPAFLWYSYAKKLSIISGLSFSGFNMSPISILYYDLLHILDPVSLFTLIFRIQEYFIPFLLPIFIIGFFLKLNVKRAYVFHFWTIGIILYTILLLNLNLIIEYYQLPYLPVFSIIIGMTISKLRSDELFKTGILILTVIFIFYSMLFSIVYSSLPDDIISNRVGQELNKILPAGAPIIIGTYSGNPSLGYYANRSSFIRTFKEISINEINYLKTRGAKYFVTTESSEENQNLTDYLTDNYNYSINVEEQYLLVNLTQPLSPH